MKYKAEDLYEDIHSMVDITCNHCGLNNHYHNLDEYDACDVFFKDGWRSTTNNVYCPKCAAKKLKQ